MNRHSRTRLAAAVLLAALLPCAPGAGAWVRTNHRERGNPDRDLYVPGGRISFHLERDGAHHIEDGSDIQAIQRAFAEINRVPTSSANVSEAGSFDFSALVTAREGLKLDGTNRIYFFVQPDPGTSAIATTSVFYEVSSGKIIEADIALNEADFRFSTETYGSPDASLGDRTFDVQDTVMHEVMHALGFGHSPIVGPFDPATGLQVAGYSTGDFSRHATTFPYSSGTIRGRTLEPDDVAALSAVYPAGAPTGSITGRVVDGATGGPVTGAHVVAVLPEEPDLPFVGTISGTGQGLGAGEFRIAGLPPGRYYIRIEPLRGTTNPFVEANSNYSGFETRFTPEFYSGDAESPFDGAVGMIDAQPVVLDAATRSASSIVIVTNAPAQRPVVESASFKGGTLKIAGSGFFVSGTAVEVDGHRLGSLRFPKKHVAANRLATRLMSKDPTLGSVMGGAAPPQLVVVNTVTGERSIPVQVGR